MLATPHTHTPHPSPTDPDPLLAGCPLTQQWETVFTFLGSLLLKLETTNGGDGGNLGTILVIITLAGPVATFMRSLYDFYEGEDKVRGYFRQGPQA